MAENMRRIHKRSCHRKVAHSREINARMAADYMRLEYAGNLKESATFVTYQCQHCNKWHVGYQNRGQEEYRQLKGE